MKKAIIIIFLIICAVLYLLFFVFKINQGPVLQEKGVIAYMQKGVQHELNGDLDTALRVYTDALEHSDDPRLFYNRGIIFFKKGLYHEAINDFNSAIDSDPKFSVSFFARGNSYMMIKDNARALADLQKAYSMGFKSAKINIDRINNEIRKSQ